MKNMEYGINISFNINFSQHKLKVNENDIDVSKL